jgi:hypothetical protein
MERWIQDEQATAIQLPMQAVDDRQLSPERRLVMAVLEDGLRCALGQAPGGRAAALRAQRIALLWLRCRDPHHAYSFSFVYCCEALALDPSAVRESLARRQIHVVARAEPRHRANRMSGRVVVGGRERRRVA